MAELTEEFLKYIFSYVLDHCGEDMAFFNRWYDQTAISTLEGIVNSNFERLTYSQAVELLKNSGERFEFPVEWGVDLQSEHERYLTEKRIGRPVIVTDYPKDIKPFYMRLNDDSKTVRAMDTLVPRIGEIVGGSQREERREGVAAADAGDRARRQQLLVVLGFAQLRDCAPCRVRPGI